MKSNEKLYENGWEYVKFEKIDNESFRIVEDFAKRTYVSEKGMIIYPDEVDRREHLTFIGNGWIKELKIFNNSSVYLEFVINGKDIPAVYLFFKNPEDVYTWNDYFFIAILNCSEEKDWTICKKEWSSFKLQQMFSLERNTTEIPYVYDVYLYISPIGLDYKLSNPVYLKSLVLKYNNKIINESYP